jgi:hypothetical protein
MSETKDTFDWVTARSLCSLRKVFETLTLEVQGDIETRNNLRPDGAQYKFNFVRKENAATVFLEANTPHWFVKFILLDKKIEVRDQNDKLMFETTVTLNNEGECRLLVKSMEYTLWQVRKLALEQMFFSV